MVKQAVFDRVSRKNKRGFAVKDRLLNRCYSDTSNKKRAMVQHRSFSKNLIAN